MNPDTVVQIIDNAIPNLEQLRLEIIPMLGPHPVPQSDERTKGMIVQFNKRTVRDYFERLPLLQALIQPFITKENGDYILAVNQTPPTHDDDFLMRPHIDRRWQEHDFSSDAPTWTKVMFLDFPGDGKGGELLVFEHTNEQIMEQLDAINRINARSAWAMYKPYIVDPIPGRICTFQGQLPHAVMGYTTHENEIWRLSIILAEFCHDAIS